jgi:hypothetical protein
MHAPGSNSDPARVSRRAWDMVFAVLLVYTLLRLVAGPLPQWLDYHDFADTRVLGFVPRAGDVLTNVAILAAGLWSLSLRHHVHVSPDERPAFRLLVVGAILTAFGSAYYHWAPSNARLVWDRLPLALLLTAIVSLVLADRVTPTFGRAALLPVGALALGSVALWGLTEAFGRGDLWLYLLVRVGASVGVLVLLIARRSRYGAAALVWAAVACDGLETVAERSDWQIWRATGGIVSGHNLKHVLAGAAIACVTGWLLLRRPLPTHGIDGG